MTQAFSLYFDRPSAYHRLHPLTKLGLAGVVLITGLMLPQVWFTYVLFIVVLLPLVLWAQVAVRFIKALWPLILPFAVSLLLIQGLFWSGGPDLFAIGPLIFKQDGLIFATRMTGRILTIVSAFLLLSLTTRPDALMLALQECGLPGTIAYIILTTLQIIPRFQARTQTILDAQRSRGLETEGHILIRIKALLPLVIPLVLGSIIDVEERAIALEVRAFNHPGPRTSLLILEDSSLQGVIRLLIMMIIVIIIILRILTGLLP